MIDKEELALRRAAIHKGMRMTLDCDVTTPFARRAPPSDLAAIRARLDALRKQLDAATARRQ